MSRIGYEIGLFPERSYRRFEAKQQTVDAEIARLGKVHRGSETLAQLLRRPGVRYKSIISSNMYISDDVIQQVEIVCKYAGYIARQENEIARAKNLEDKQIPPQFDYGSAAAPRASQGQFKL